VQTPAIEAVVEQIALALHRGLSLEDLDGVLLAYSSHQGTADRVRVNFLLSKKVPADVSDWQIRHGIATSVRPVAVPANAELGMLGRVCVPLLVRGFRVGYLWVQQESEDDPAAGILAALPGVRAETDRLAELLLEVNTADSQHRIRRENDFLAACGGAAPALEDLRGWPEMEDGGPWRIGVIADAGAHRPRAADPDAGILMHRTVALQATVGVEPFLFSAGTATHSVLLLRAGLGNAAHLDVLRRYSEGLAKRAGRPPELLVLGLGEPFGGLGRIADSYAQARSAAQAAGVEPQLSGVVEYRSIGVYQLLAAAGWQAAAAQSIHFGELEEQDRAGELLPVLELLYDKNGSVQDVAAQLHLHRSSVYNRLARIRSIIGADPLSGSVRLELHLALKARRWMLRPRF
jgi:hypothetical protein